MIIILSRNTVYRFFEPDFGPALHAKRLLSLSLATVGVCHAPRASIAEIGRSLAAATGKNHVPLQSISPGLALGPTVGRQDAVVAPASAAGGAPLSIRSGHGWARS
jgi:hypothetical protein